MQSGTRLPPDAALGLARCAEGRTVMCHIGPPTTLLATDAGGGDAMTVFYRGPCAYVTHEVFEVHCPYYRQYLIRDIRDPYLARRPIDPGQPDRLQLKARSAGAAGAAAVAAVFGWPVLKAASVPPMATAGLVLTLIVVGVSAMAIAACLRVRPARMYELWAVYRGRMTCLFETTDERVFGQVRRALVRAIEQNQYG